MGGKEKLWEGMYMGEEEEGGRVRDTQEEMEGGKMEKKKETDGTGGREADRR